jgi:hypothetical protein
MRIWSIHLGYLDWRGLGALWRETLLAQKVLGGGTRGWRSHPQLDRFRSHSDPLRAVGYYLVEVHMESRRRGYSYDYSKILEPEGDVKRITVTRGQLDYEFTILNERLKRRDVSKYRQNMAVVAARAHPLFEVVKGPPEPWEKSYWGSVEKD